MSGYLSKKIIEATGPFIRKTGLHKLCRNSFGGKGHILMLHRIIPENERLRIHNHKSLEITPDQLDSTIRFFKEKNYEFYSLDTLFDKLKGNNLRKPFVVFTLDDGYLDNLTNAFPVFKKHQVPFTVYVATCFPDRTAVLWWYLLEQRIINSDEIEYCWNGKEYKYVLNTIFQKEKVFDLLRDFISQSASEKTRNNKIEIILGDIKEKNQALLNSICMTWEQLIALSKDPLVTIGCHSLNHTVLSKLSNEEMQHEMLESKRILEERLNLPIHHFAYPFGKRSEASIREFEVAKQCGFHTATTTRIGNIQDGHDHHLCALPRININKSTRKDVLELQTSGFIPMIVNKGVQMVTD